MVDPRRDIPNWKRRGSLFGVSGSKTCKMQFEQSLVDESKFTANAVTNLLGLDFLSLLLVHSTQEQSIELIRIKRSVMESEEIIRKQQKMGIKAAHIVIRAFRKAAKLHQERKNRVFQEQESIRATVNAECAKPWKSFSVGPLGARVVFDPASEKCVFPISTRSASDVSRETRDMDLTPTCIGNLEELKLCDVEICSDLQQVCFSTHAENCL